MGKPSFKFCKEFGQLVRLRLARQRRVERRRGVTEQPRMNVLAELPGKKRHEHRAAIVSVRDHKVGRAAREYRRVTPRPFEQLLPR